MDPYGNPHYSIRYQVPAPYSKIVPAKSAEFSHSTSTDGADDPEGPVRSDYSPEITKAMLKSILNQHPINHENLIDTLAMLLLRKKRCHGMSKEQVVKNLSVNLSKIKEEAVFSIAVNFD